MQGKPILPSMPHVTWKILTTNLNEVRSNLEQNMGCLGFAVRRRHQSWSRAYSCRWWNSPGLGQSFLGADRAPTRTILSIYGWKSCKSVAVKLPKTKSRFAMYKQLRVETPSCMSSRWRKRPSKPTMDASPILRNAPNTTNNSFKSIPKITWIYPKRIKNLR